MKKLILPLLFLVFSSPSYSAVGWFYHDEISAIKKALDSNPGEAYRGSYLKSIQKTSTGYKINLTDGCIINLERAMAKVKYMGPTGPNEPVILRVDKNTSGCRR